MGLGSCLRAARVQLAGPSSFGAYGPVYGQGMIRHSGVRSSKADTQSFQHDS